MRYLETDYKLKQVTPEVYKAESRKVALLQQMDKLEGAMRVVTREEAPRLGEFLLGYGDYLHGVYGHGGGHFGFAACVGLAALRAVNPVETVPPIQPQDWDAMMQRQEELQRRPGLVTVEEVQGVGLLEMRDVNAGYVDGYQEQFDTPDLSPVLGFTGMGTLMAHDMMHFASVRDIDSAKTT